MNRIFFILAVMAVGNVHSEEFLLGKYSAVFESEYSVEIIFMDKGGCEMRQLLFFPEEVPEKQQEITTTKCTWSISDQIVSVKYKGGEGAYQYVPSLSCLPHASNEFYPGLVPLTGSLPIEMAYMWNFGT